jgi:hypothetical protein
VSESRRVWSRREGAHGGLREPSEGGESMATSLGSEKVGKGEAGNGLGMGVVMQRADKEEVSEGSAVEWGL